MVAEYRQSPRTPRPGPRRNRQARLDDSYNPNAAALAATIRALWGKERRLGHYAPIEELCLNLDQLEIEALRALKARMIARINERLCIALCAAVAES